MNALNSFHCFRESIRTDCDLDLQLRLTAYLTFYSDIGRRASQRTPRPHHWTVGQTAVVIPDVSCINLPKGRLEYGEMCFGDEDF